MKGQLSGSMKAKEKMKGKERITKAVDMKDDKEAKVIPMQLHL